MVISSTYLLNIVPALLTVATLPTAHVPPVHGGSEMTVGATDLAD